MITIIAASGPTMAHFTFCGLEDDPRLPFPLHEYRQSGRWNVEFNRRKDKLAKFNKFVYRSGSVGHWLPVELAEVPNHILKAYIKAVKELQGAKL